MSTRQSPPRWTICRWTFCSRGSAPTGGVVIGATLLLCFVMAGTQAQGQDGLWLPDVVGTFGLPGSVTAGHVPNPQPALNDHFGWLVSGSNDLLAVTAAYSAGSVYLYIRDPVTGAWQLDGGTSNLPGSTIAGLVPNPQPTEVIFFGAAVSAGENVLAVGARTDLSPSKDVGSAYLYERNLQTGQWQAADTTSLLGSMIPGHVPNPQSTTGDRFGWEITISVEGGLLVVGAYQDDAGASDAGSVYLYKRDPLGAWQLDAGTSNLPGSTIEGHIPNPQPTEVDWFGYSLSLSSNLLAIGAPYDDAGANNAGSVYLYERDNATGEWQLDSGTSNLPGSTIAGHIPNPQPEDNDGFGRNVSVSGDRLVVGAHLDGAGASNVGSVYLYERDNATGEWQPADTSALPGSSIAGHVPNPQPGVNDGFGAPISVQGNVLAVGCYGFCGPLWLYERDFQSGQWQFADTSALGSTLAGQVPYQSGLGGGFSSLYVSGDLLVAGSSYDDYTGAPQSGSVYLYRRSEQIAIDFVISANTAVIDTSPPVGTANVLVTVDEAMSPSPEIAGFSMSMGHDGAVLENPTVQMSTTLAALNGGTGPGFWAVNPCAEGVTIGTIFDIVDPCAQVLPVTGGLEVATVGYEVTATAASAGTPLQTSVYFIDGLCTVQGPVFNTVSDCGGESSTVPEANRIGAIVDFVIDEQFMRPDCNGDGVYNIGDAITTLGYLFNGDFSIGCLAACDANADAGVDIADAITMLQGLFIPGSPPIAEPFGACGFESTYPSLGCFGYGSCP